MSDEKKCTLCETSSNDKPLMKATFKGKKAYICPTCMPAIIHGPGADQLAEKFKD